MTTMTVTATITAFHSNDNEREYEVDANLFAQLTAESLTIEAADALIEPIVDAGMIDKAWAWQLSIYIQPAGFETVLFLADRKAGQIDWVDVGNY